MKLLRAIAVHCGVRKTIYINIDQIQMMEDVGDNETHVWFIGAKKDMGFIVVDSNIDKLAIEIIELNNEG